MARLVWPLIAVLAGLVILAMPVVADDCGTPQDCEETATYNTAIAVAGGALAVGAGIYGGLMGAQAGAGSAGAAAGGQPPPGPSGPEQEQPRFVRDPGTGLVRDTTNGDLLDPGLIDPWDGEPLLVNDGTYVDGEPGMIWWGEGQGDNGWVTRAEAEELIEEGRAAIRQRGEEIATHMRETERILGESFETMHRENAQAAAREAFERQRREDAWSDHETAWNSALRRGDFDLIERIDAAFGDDGTIDVEQMDRVAEVARARIQRDIAAPDEELERSVIPEFLSETGEEILKNPVIRIGSAVLTGGSSEVVFQGAAIVERVQENVNQSVDQGLDYNGWDAVYDAGSVFAEENLPVNTIRNISEGNTSAWDIGTGLVMDAFATLDGIETGVNLRGSLNRARAGKWGEAMTHRAADNVYQTIRETGPTVPRGPRVPEASGYPPPGGIPMELPTEWGMPRQNAVHINQVASEELVNIRVRPTNKWTPQHLAEGAAPKPMGIKWKSTNEIDTQFLGAKPGSEGLVGVWEPPELPAQKPPDVDDGLWNAVQRRHKQRMDQWNEYQAGKGQPGKGLDETQFSVDEDGLIRNANGQKITGDHDIFDIRNHDGRRLEDVMSREEAWRTKQRVIARLHGGPADVQHGAHQDFLEQMRRNYYEKLGYDPDNLPTDQPVPVWEPTEKELDKIYNPLFSGHTGGTPGVTGPGEALVDFGPGRSVRTSHAEWGEQVDWRSLSERGFQGGNP